MQKAMGIATRTPSCRNTSGFGCLYLRSARASGLCSPSGSKTRTGPGPYRQRGTRPLRCPHTAPSTVPPPRPGQPIGTRRAQRSVRPRAGLGHGLGHVSGAGSPTGATRGAAG